MRPLICSLLALGLAACAATSTTTPPPAPDVMPVPDPALAAAPDAAPAPATAEPDARPVLEELGRALHAGDFTRAAERLEAARAMVGGKHPRVEAIVYYQAALAAYRGDFAGAAATLNHHLASGGVPADSYAWFNYHNALIMLVTAQADLPGALAECAAMTEAGQHPPFSNDPEGPAFVLLKKHWHEAYLLRMVAAALGGGRAHDGALAGALAAREAYRTLATQVGHHADSIAVLDGFFAVHDGRPYAALAAARLVDLASNDDVEDLYLTQMAFDFGGDGASAQKVRARMAALEDISLAIPIMSTWLRRDADAAAGGPTLWTPRHPRGQMP